MELNKPKPASLMDPAVQQCPFDFYKSLRDTGSVHLMPETGVYIVTSYALLMEVLKKPKIFSNLPAAGRRAGLFCAEAERIVAEKGYGRFMPTIVNNDPPGHTIYRSLVNDAFRAGRIRQMELYIREIADELVSKIGIGGECDAVSEFAVPLPMYVIADQLGVSRADFAKFKEWSDAWVIGLGMPVADSVLIDAAEKVVEMQHYMIARMHERRADPRDDIMSDLVQAKFNNERPLTDKEVLSIIEQILVAGNETTTNGITNGLKQIAEDGALQTRLRENPDQLPQFVEEILRFESPVQGLFRYVTEDTELGGVSLPQNSTVMVCYAAGNRDDARFDDPENFNIERKNSGAHIAFGSGIHHCVGSQLARAEMSASFSAFLRRFSDFRLAEPGKQVQYHKSFVLRGPEHLHLRVSVSG